VSGRSDQSSVVYKDLLIVGGRNPRLSPASRRHSSLRRSNRKAALVVSHHPRPGEFWAMTLWPKGCLEDQRRGEQFGRGWRSIPSAGLSMSTGSAAFDFYGADPSVTIFRQLLIALNAQNGRESLAFFRESATIFGIATFLPAASSAVKRDGKEIDAVAQTTKKGFVFSSTRTNGRPLFPHLIPKISSEHWCPAKLPPSSKPLPTRPAPFAASFLTEDLPDRAAR